MKPKNWFNEKLSQYENDPDENDPEFQAEELRIDIIEQVLKMMENENVTRAELSRRLACSNAYISKLRNGSENLTVLKLTQIANVFHSKIDITFIPKRVTLPKVFRHTQPITTIQKFNRVIKTGDEHVLDIPIAA